MLFTPANREDISKYYRNSWLKLKETGDLLFYVKNVESNAVTGQVEDGRDFKLYLAEEEPYEVDYILPHKSFFQYEKDAMMLQRIPAKQYHRGVTAENTAFFFRKHGEALGQLPPDFQLLKAFVQKQKFFTLSEAIEAKVNSAALSPRMMYMRESKLIHIDFLPVARVQVGNKIRMVAPIFQEEVMDFLKSTQEDNKFNIVEVK
jgi:hypothetical protein